MRSQGVPLFGINMVDDWLHHSGILETKNVNVHFSASHNMSR